MLQIIHAQAIGSKFLRITNGQINEQIAGKELPEILIISTTLPRKCGIATYSHDLIKALNSSFGNTFKIGICALETNTEKCNYGKEVSLILNTDCPKGFDELAATVNASKEIRIVVIQHEFGLFASNDTKFEWFISALTKPVIVSFHTVLPDPGESLKMRVQHIANSASSVIVLTKASTKTLVCDYCIAKDKIVVIAHSASWQNAAIAHAELFQRTLQKRISLKYSIPEINLAHINKLTTDFGIIHYSRLNKPDILSGYTIDDNAQALITFCQHYELTGDESDLKFIRKYFRFIQFCQQPEGSFLNYVDANFNFIPENEIENVEDSNGRVIWALGYLISMGNLLPEDLNREANSTFKRILPNVQRIRSTRAMAFIIKGLYYFNTKTRSEKNISIIKELANRLVQMYRHECHQEWYWFESRLTYANSLLPEAMLCVWLATNQPIYKIVAKESFDFFLSKAFNNNIIHVVSNKNLLHKKGGIPMPYSGSEKPIDVAYTIMALSKFYNVFKEKEYIMKMENSFNWFLGKNHISQIMYNPCTGGCYDGIEFDYINLNQGAESAISYLMARLTVEKVLWTEAKCKTIHSMSAINDHFNKKV